MYVCFQNVKLRALAFELIGSDEKEVYNLAAETSDDLEDWIVALSKAMNLGTDTKSCMKYNDDVLFTTFLISI